MKEVAQVTEMAQGAGVKGPSRAALGAPQRVEALEIERRRQQAPFGHHRRAASVQEAPGAGPLFAQAEGRLHQRASAPVPCR